MVFFRLWMRIVKAPKGWMIGGERDAVKKGRGGPEVSIQRF